MRVEIAPGASVGRHRIAAIFCGGLDPQVDWTPRRIGKFCLSGYACLYNSIRIYYRYMGDALRRFKSEIFQALAHPTRIAIVEALRDGELSAGQLIERLGIEQANASQHLAILRAKHVLVNRKAGNQVFYSIRDPALIKVLEILRRYFYSQLSSTVSMLEEAAQAGPAKK